jgi:hypothetical protein
MASCCNLDYESFQDNIRHIVAISDGLGDEWQLVTSKVGDPLGRRLDSQTNSSSVS